MEFKQLRVALDNRRDQEPSVYLALCIMEFLLSDIKEESGGNALEKCGLGDDKAPTKMIQIIRRLNAVYEEKKGEFTRNLTNLENAVTGLKETEAQLNVQAAETEKQLAAQADAAGAVERARERLQGLEKQLTDAQARQEEAKTLEEQITAKEAELRKLQGFDWEAERRKAGALDGEISKLNQAIGEYRARELAPRETAKADANDALAKLKEEADSLDKEFKRIDGQRKDEINEIARLKKVIPEVQAQLDQKTGEKSSWLEKKEKLEQSIKDLKGQIAELEGQIDGKTEELGTLQDKSYQLEHTDLP